MNAEIRAVILRALHLYRGDDYERASRAFAGLTPMQMQMPHGQSGKTRQEMLDEYRTHIEQIERAIRALDPAMNWSSDDRPRRRDGH